MPIGKTSTALVALVVMATGCTGSPPAPHPDVTAREPQIQHMVRDQLRDMSCFLGPRLPRAEQAECESCAPLAEVGFIELHAGRTPGQGEWRLTALGRQHYDGTRWRFCLGQPRLGAILASTPPRVVFGNVQSVVSMRVSVDDAHPLIYDARLHALGLLAPEAEPPTRYPPQCMTIDLFPNGDVGLAAGQVASGVRFCRHYYIK